ncbi:PREDICTED: 39S ribosomal protein L10, mitochondrial [Nicrophorus vespilloides]|uniref:Large ribosomal subunit protein uL10m n=1 Tax=Nicrophorus vespilloides TaxID=110193 RepID=A0ABM1MU99_NICVS|nr:PREDICTED: 39S ribosomal protein L10, mitochondrial [Nicrophorus vespilloides]
MSFLSRKGFLDVVSVCTQAKRFRGKINIQKPQVPHFERARLLAVTKPIVIKQNKSNQKETELCMKNVRFFNKTYIENPLQNIYANETLEKFQSSKMIVFFHMNPMSAEEHFKAYVTFNKQNMLYKNIGKKTLDIALKGTPYEAILNFYMCHNMIVFSPEMQIKKLLKISKRFPQLVVLAGVLDGRFVSKDELLYYSNIPNIQTAQAQLVHTLNSIGGNIVSQLNCHQQTFVSQLSERIKQLEEEK